MLGKFATGALCVGLIGGGLLFQDGVVTVNVQEKQKDGDHVFVMAPAVLAAWGVKFVPDDAWKDVPQEAREAFPAIIAAADKLSDLPDFTLVEVQGRHETVKVQKINGSIVVDVDSDHESVHVAVPLRAVRHTIANLGDRMAHAPLGKSIRID